MPVALDAYLDALRHDVHAGLERIVAELGAPPILADAIRYALLGPGKRLRPCLTLGVADAVAARMGVDVAVARSWALPAACAVEMIHTYSLVHDDLPAMDNDALRRGRPTTHVVYGDGMAILAGDALVTDAFAVVARGPAVVANTITPPPEGASVRAVAVLAAAAGAAGMVGGQAIDLAAANRVLGHPLTLDAPALEDMHLRKTGALIRASCALGAIMTGADDALVAAVDAYARDLGLAFQIVDDILDVEGSAAALGKTAGKDAAAGKPTFVALHGLAPSKQRAADCVARAKATLRDAGLHGRLAEIADWSLSRTK